MPVIRNFEDARDELKKFYNQPGSNTYTLDRMRQLVEYLGNPQEKLKIIHVAGTSGKSSTSYYASALLSAAGCKVGLTVSPHVVDINERVQINNVPMPENDFCESLGTFIDKVNASAITPSYFELMIAFAFTEFVRQNVDYAVIEVGLGGLIDGTNVIAREDKISIITDIGYDHTNILGNTLHEIATQKAGIIMPGNHVFTYIQATEISDVIRAVCHQKTAQLHELHAPEQIQPELSELPKFQQRNFYLAEQAVDFVLQRDGHGSLSNDQLAKAAKFQVPGRMQIIDYKGKTLVLDGAHNGQKMAALIDSMQAKYPDKPVAALVSFVQNRDERWQHALDELKPYVTHIIATSFDLGADDMPKKSMPADAIAAYLQNIGANYEIEPRLSDAVKKLLNSPEPVLLVTGSLYPIGLVEHLLQN
ncbi:MAG TPA: Mur ligase family protein [Candidatus Saccharimonadales bacterium]|nr:Mur ligase family protein [Candidatus Saccharimonadales bacterium]